MSEPVFLIVMKLSFRSRNDETKRSGSVLETRDSALSPRVIVRGGEDTKKKQDGACFCASCGGSVIPGPYIGRDGLRGA